MSDTSSRLLTLLSLLQARRDWPGAELARRLEVSGRTVRRDVERLRELGYPVESLTGPAGGYTLHAGTAMPPLLVDDEEAVAIAVGLRTAAGLSVAGIEETAVRALVKLEQVLPTRLRRRVAALGWATSTPPAGGPEVDPEHLTVIATACRDTERLRFAYRDRQGTESRREVEPYAVVNLGLRWYLVAWDPAREDWRTFRVDRLTRPASTGVRFAPRELPAEDAATFVNETLATQPYRYQARVVLHAPVEEIRRHLPSGWGTADPLGDRATELRTGDDDLQWLALRVAMFGVDFDVREPPELREQFQALARRLDAAAHAHGPASPLG
jgi:predicted DNA-binding transcriptional regulator YafY